MQLTLDLPDDLHRRVLAKAAHAGQSLDALTADLYRRWLAEPDAEAKPAAEAEPTPEQQLEAFFALADKLMANLPPGPTALEWLEEDRNRLEPKGLERREG